MQNNFNEFSFSSGASTELQNLYRQYFSDSEEFLTQISQADNHHLVVELFEEMSKNETWVAENPRLVAEIFNRLDIKDLRNFSPAMQKMHEVCLGSGVFPEVQKIGEEKDVFVISTDGIDFAVDKRLLIMSSSRFRDTIFSERYEDVKLKEQVTSRIELNDFSPSAVQFVLDYIHKKSDISDIAQNETLLTEVTFLSDYLGIEILKKDLSKALITKLYEKVLTSSRVKMFAKLAENCDLKELALECQKVKEHFDRMPIQKDHHVIKDITSVKKLILEEEEMKLIAKNLRLVGNVGSVDKNSVDAYKREVFRPEIQTLIRALSNLSRTESLILDGVFAMESGELTLKELTNEMMCFPLLRQFKASHCSPCFEAGLNKLLKNLQENCPNLEVLDLQNCIIENEKYPISSGDDLVWKKRKNYPAGIDPEMLTDISKMYHLEILNLVGNDILGPPKRLESLLLKLPYLHTVYLPKELEGKLSLKELSAKGTQVIFA